MPYRFVRTATLILALGGCSLLNRKPAGPPPPDPPLADEAAADSLLVDVQKVEPTIVIDLRYATKNNFTGAPLPGYTANRAFLRAEAADALALVQEDLRLQGLGLKVFDAYRPVRATEAMVTWTQTANRPDLLKDGYIASKSKHNLGVAIDLTVINLATKQELVMGTPFDHFSPAAWTKNASGVILQNRLLLKKVMERQGFANYDKEWWHYTYTVADPFRFDRVIQL